MNNDYTHCGTPMVYAGKLRLHAGIWTDEELTDYECALETIGNVIALRARDIAHERQQPRPDHARIQALQAEQARLASERHSLRIGDTARVQFVVEHYGSLVRSTLQGHCN